MAAVPKEFENKTKEIIIGPTSSAKDALLFRVVPIMMKSVKRLLQIKNKRNDMGVISSMLSTCIITASKGYFTT